MSKPESLPIDLPVEAWKTVLGILRARVPDRDVWAFGSRAAWKAKEYSDLDLAVDGSEPLPLATLADLDEDFALLDLPIRVDVIDLASTNRSFREVIEANRTLIQRGSSMRFVRLGDVCTKIGSGATPRGGKDVYLETGPVALIRSQNIHNEGFQKQGLAYLNWEQANKLDNVEVRKNDVLLNITGDSVARCCLTPENHLPARVNQHVAIIRPDTEQLDPVFLRFFLVSQAQQDRMLALASSGATRNALTKEMIESFQVPCPPIDHQRAVGQILLAIEKRIASLGDTNETLEAMARAIFKSWFVDFDPVRAKAEGREPEGMDAATAALFPETLSSVRDSIMPSGWRPTTLGAEVAAHGGRIQTGPFGSQLHAADYVPEGPPVVMPQDITNRRVREDRISRIREADANRLARHRLEIGDLIYSRRGDVEKHAHIGEREVGWLCGTGCLLVRMGAKWSSSTFVSHALDRPETRAWIAQHAIGATMPNLNTGILSSVPLLVPGEPVLKAFDDISKPIEDAISMNGSRAATLADLRDTLLPRLISGKLRIPEAEKLVGAVL